MNYGNLVFLPDRNSRKRDYSGAFLPESKAYARFHNIPANDIFEVDVSKGDIDRRQDVAWAIRKRGKEYGLIKSVAFFCHGLKNQIQLGYNIHNVHLLSALMGECCDEEVVVPIYACSAARDMDKYIADDMDPETVGGDGGFADKFRDNLCNDNMAYCRVMAHVTAGHTTVNPWVRFFDGNGNPYGGDGGYWVITPKSELWRPWINWLRKDNNRFRFPFMSQDDIIAEIQK